MFSDLTHQSSLKLKVKPPCMNIDKTSSRHRGVSLFCFFLEVFLHVVLSEALAACPNLIADWLVSLTLWPKQTADWLVSLTLWPKLTAAWLVSLTLWQKLTADWLLILTL